MNLQVLLEIRSGRELFVADVADVGFFPCVYSLMANEIGHLGESLVAALVLANVRSLAIMHSRMLL